MLRKAPLIPGMGVAGVGFAVLAAVIWATKVVPWQLGMLAVGIGGVLAIIALAIANIGVIRVIATHCADDDLVAARKRALWIYWIAMIVAVSVSAIGRSTQYGGAALVTGVILMFVANLGQLEVIRKYA